MNALDATATPTIAPVVNHSPVDIFGIILQGKVLTAWNTIDQMDPEHQATAYATIGVTALIALVAVIGIVVFVWMRWIRYLFNETTPGHKKELKNKIKSSANLELHRDHNNQSLNILITTIRDKERGLALFKNRLFEKLMRFCENQIDIIRSKILISAQEVIDTGIHESSCGDQDFQIFRLLSQSSRLDIMIHLRSFLKFDDIAIKKLENEEFYNDADIESRLQFLKSKYFDVFQTNDYGLTISVIDVATILDQNDEIMHTLMKEIFEFYHSSLKQYADRVVSNNDEIEELKKLFLNGA